ncbi:trypco2 family protein [Nocardia sp. alder85J]|uniref:trypco2 family protein n=1 Tax=Nocardia sp. alder85J TaxID=2862949 RepID=UPI001CD2BD23|nr:trypco2 family protein [Nocardia sp. alder85J]MCX4091964.1 hypothetical protein [Nocardia sp. alder85J]
MEIELGDAVAALRDQLLDAAARGADENLRFVVGPVELSFEVELHLDTKVKGGLKAYVVTGEIEAGASRVRHQKVTITLTPKNRGGGDILVGSSDRAPGPGPVSGPLGR